MSPTRASSGAGRGFTLIELLIVMSVIAILVGMLSTMLAVAQRMGRATNSRAILARTDQAVRLFRTDMLVYPWQTDLGVAPAEPAAWGNNLGFRLAWNPPADGTGTAADPDRPTYCGWYQADLAAIQDRFRFVDGSNVPPTGSASEGTHAFRNEPPSATSRTNLLLAPGTLSFTQTNIWKDDGWIMGSKQFMPGWAGATIAANKINDCTAHAQALTAYAQQIAAQLYTAGQMPVLAPAGMDAALPADKARHPREDERHVGLPATEGSAYQYRYVPYNKLGVNGDDARGPVLTAATARASGWRADYLADALVRSGGPGRAEIDPTGTAILDAWGRPLVYVCAVRPGVRGTMHGLTSTIWSGSLPERYEMTSQGRTSTRAIASDVRTTAGSAFVLEFELWSAGPDGLFAARRDDPANRDNIALQAYNRGLE